MPKQVLERYGAMTARVVYPGETEEHKATGGNLADTVQEYGVGPLAGLLHARPDVNALELIDEEVSLRLERNGVGALLVVEWRSGERFTESVEIEPHPGSDQAVDGPLFRPDPDSRVDDVEAGLRSGEPLYGIDSGEGQRWYSRGRWGEGAGAVPLGAWVDRAEPLGPAWFREQLGVKANYVSGAMAGGITSAELVIAMAQAGYLAFYGSGGLPLAKVKEDVSRIRETLGDLPCGFNLLHNPVEPQVEESTVDFYLEQGCRFVSASAYMDLTAAIVRYRYAGIRVHEGRIVCPNRVFAKVSRAEVAGRFLRPAPSRMLKELVSAGALTAEEAALAAKVPMADALTAEADSGGHTDRRPLSVLVPLLRELRDSLAIPGWPVALGAAGGIGTPQAIHAAFQMGADYVLTGSVNQCSLEAGTSELAKSMLLDAGMADVASGPAPDMFELGAHVQVLSRGTMYARRGDQLYRIYKDHESWDQVAEKTRAKVEKQILARSFDEVWADCVDYWTARDAKQVERAKTDGRHKMALVFRWYLGMTSRWARMGEEKRKRDFQIWCGPAMGAFNAWVEGTDMAKLQSRSVVAIAEALLEGASLLERAQQLAGQGIPLPASVFRAKP